MQQEKLGQLYLRLLGPFTLSAAGRPLPLPRRKDRALLAFLALAGSPMVPRESLLSVFWPDETADNGRAQLRQAFSRLRRTLPQAPQRENGGPVDLLLSGRKEIGINPDADFDSDVAAFRRLLDNVRTHRHASLEQCGRCAGDLRTAVALYQEDFLLDLTLGQNSPFDTWAAEERAVLRDDLLYALSQLANIYMAAGQYGRAEPIVRRRIAIAPAAEPAYRQLMTLLARSGRQSEALAVYETVRGRLARAGAAPSAATRALQAEILAETIDERTTKSELAAFEMREEIAHGAYGVIFRAYQPSVDREVAIKAIRPEIASNRDFTRRLETEARIVARLEHPHIVPIYTFWHDENGAFLVMRLLHGGSLREMLRRGALEHAFVLKILDQIADALDAVHQHGVVHRDLKPGNILLDESGNAYLTDFGIAKDLVLDEHSSGAEALVGSPAYISPEQLRSEPVTPRSDIYSLGIILYQMLAGEPPFKELSLAALLQHQLNEPIPLLSEGRASVPAAVDRVLARATAKRPEDRYPDVLSLAADFRQALESGVDGEEALSAPGLPAYLEPPGIREAPQDAPLFVARKAQLADLRERFDEAGQGQGQVVCITGGAGRGKSTLLAEFARRMMAEKPRLLVAMGSCNAFSAAGDPYLPFRELLAVLTADVESRLRAGAVSPDHARRLWAALPDTVQVLVEHGPDLIGSLLPARPLLARARSAAPVDAPWLADLRALSERTADFEASDPDPQRLFSHLTAVLSHLSDLSPLLIILDDLQWIDNATAALLFHLCRHLSGRRILLACAYRPDEVAIGRDGARHPLEKVLAEIKREYGAAWIDLSELAVEEGQQFIDALLDDEPNRLDEEFRQALYNHTAGHPLFTVELLRALQERGDLQKDEKERWVSRPDLDWHALPPRIEGVIEERIGRLPPHLQDILATASVEGEFFTAQVVARVEGLEGRRTWQILSRELQDIHHLIREQEETRLERGFLTRYRFNHTLFQQYLYDRLGQGERRLLHGRIAESLQDLLGETWQTQAAALARHFQEADRPEDALPFWLYLGDQARTTYAHAAAERYYQAAVAELRLQSRQEEAARTLMKLGLVYTADFQAQKAQQVYEEAFALWDQKAHAAPTNSDGAVNAILRLALEMPSTLDPGLIDDDVSTFMATQLFEGLVRIGKDHNVLPAAAQRWEVLENGYIYRFYLRPDLHWSSGRKLTANDFVYAWQRNLSSQTKSPSAHLLYIIKNSRAFAEGELPDGEQLGVKALDDLTLEVKLEQPAAYLPYILAHAVTFPLAWEAIEGKQEQWTQPGSLVSNGPFEYDAGSSDRLILLSRSTAFEQRLRGNITRIECPIYARHDESLEAYERDEIDAVSLLNASPEIILRAKSLFGTQVLSIPRPSTLYVNFRNDRPPFDDPRVRQAFAHAIDKESLAAEAFAGLRQPATGGFVPPGMSGHSPGIALPFDPQRAQELLADAGFAGGSGFPPIKWVSAPGGEHLIAFLRRAWESCLGLRLQASALDFPLFLQQLADDPANLMLLGFGADFPDPSNVLRTPFHSTAGRNGPRWKNEQFDRLTDRAEQVRDNEERMILYRRADKILVAEEAAVIPLVYGQGNFLVKPRVLDLEASTIAVSLQAARLDDSD